MMQGGGHPVWRVIRGGSHRYVERLTAPFRDRIRLSTPVRAVRRRAEGVAVRHDGGAEHFDHAVIAAHADQALAMLEDPTPMERELLSAFPYQANDAVLHTDAEAVLPRRRRAWSSWNAHVEAGNRNRVAVTYNMNRLQSLDSRHTFCVTLNEHERIEPSRIFRRIRYHHPVYTARQAEAQARHDELIDANRTSFCGAYWGYGFHEDGVQSAERVCAALNAAGSEAACVPRPGGTGDNGRAKEAAV